MYGFVAQYENWKTQEKRTQLIEVEEQFFDSVKEIYVYAMGKAYDMRKAEEELNQLEFIYC